MSKMARYHRDMLAHHENERVACIQKILDFSHPLLTADNMHQDHEEADGARQPPQPVVHDMAEQDDDSMPLGDHQVTATAQDDDSLHLGDVQVTATAKDDDSMPIGDLQVTATEQKDVGDRQVSPSAESMISCQDSEMADKHAHT